MCKWIQSMNKSLTARREREQKESIAERTYLMEQRQEWARALRWVRVWGWPLGWVQE